jgi:SHS2 domain-containing protein
MTEAKKIEPKIEEVIEVEGYDEQALLYNWLEAFLVKFDTTSKLYSRFQISKIERIKEGYKLKAKIWGETYNSERHPQKVGIKAVTYHRMEIIKKLEKVTLKFILDI